VAGTAWTEGSVSLYNNSVQQTAGLFAILLATAASYNSLTSATRCPKPMAVLPPESSAAGLSAEAARYSRNTRSTHRRSSSAEPESSSQRRRYARRYPLRTRPSNSISRGLTKRPVLAVPRRMGAGTVVLLSALVHRSGNRLRLSQRHRDSAGWRIRHHGRG